LAETIYRIGNMYGATPFLKVVTTDSPGVTIAAVNYALQQLASLERLSEVEHQVYVIHNIT
jgi:hypothetical protein